MATSRRGAAMATARGRPSTSSTGRERSGSFRSGRVATRKPSGRSRLSSASCEVGMTCRELVDFLRAYLDGELSEDVRRRFEENLAACPECAAYLKTYRETVKL